MPYDPQTSYRGDQYIFQGKSKMMQTVGDIIENSLNQAKQTKAYRTMAVDVMGMDPGKVDGMNYADLQAILHGKAAQAQTDEAQARTALAKSEAAKAQMDADANSGFPDFAKYLNEEMSGGAQAPAAAGPAAGPIWPPPGGVGLSLALPAMPGGSVTGPAGAPVQTSGTGAAGPGRGSPPMMGSVLRALSRVGAMNPRVAQALASKVLPPMLNAGAEDLTPGSYKDPTTGAVFAFRGKQFLPAGFDPKMASDAAAPTAAHDDDGNLIGFTQTDIKGRSTFHPFKGGNKLAAAKDGDGNTIPGFYLSSEGKILDTRSALTKMTGEAPAASGNSAPKVLTPDLAQEYLKKAGGDKTKARDAARKDGYTF